MHDTQVSVSVSLSRIVAWSAWVATIVLLSIGAVLDHQWILASGLAMSAVAATLHIRCFCIRLSREVHAIAEVVQRQCGPPNARPVSGLSSVAVEKD